jgi:hypothetical protein
VPGIVVLEFVHVPESEATGSAVPGLGSVHVLVYEFEATGIAVLVHVHVPEYKATESAVPGLGSVHVLVYEFEATGIAVLVPGPVLGPVLVTESVSRVVVG